MSKETWKPIADFPTYEVSNHGRIRSWINTRGNRSESPHIVKNSVQDPGYCMVNLRANGKTHKRWVHTLVLEAFVGPRPEGQVARHFPDNDRTNCNLSNLQWGSYEQNENDKKVIGIYPEGEKHYAAKLTDEQITDIRTRLSNGERAFELAAEFRVSRSHISMIRHGKVRKSNYAP